MVTDISGRLYTQSSRGRCLDHKVAQGQMHSKVKTTRYEMEYNSEGLFIGHQKILQRRLTLYDLTARLYNMFKSVEFCVDFS